MALSRVVSEIFNVEKCRDLEIVIKGHSRSLRVFDSKNVVTLKTGLGVHQSHLEMSPFDREHMTSYCHSI